MSTEATEEQARESAEAALVRSRLWELADDARALARPYSAAEETLDLLDETDPPAEAERTELDRDDSLVAPADPMPQTYSDSEPEEPEPGDEPPALSWGVVARTALALGYAGLVGVAGSQLLQLSFGSSGALPETLALGFPGALVALTTAGAAPSLRRVVASPTAPPEEVRRQRARWSPLAVTVFALGAATSTGAFATWAFWWSGTPVLIALATAVGVVTALAQVPFRAPGPLSWSSPGSLLSWMAVRGKDGERRREARRTARRWRQARGRSRAAIRVHTEAWQAVHHRCHLEVELGNPQDEELAKALFVLRGTMFGRELPGDSDDAPAVPPLTGNLEVAVHNLTVYHPDRLARRLRENGERIAREVS